MVDDERERDRKQRAGDKGEFAGQVGDVALDVAAGGGLGIAVRAVAAVGRAVGHGTRAVVEALT
ncbi:hypothetical protein [Streptomyces luteireticuli]|uniref:Uncharacterized protein n=1 Tax=Streptomyces luteireticuli TaxID=173858 RepID=A0ABN0Z544_9ACTN